MLVSLTFDVYMGTLKCWSENARQSETMSLPLRAFEGTEFGVGMCTVQQVENGTNSGLTTRVHQLSTSPYAIIKHYRGLTRNEVLSQPKEWRTGGRPGLGNPRASERSRPADPTPTAGFTGNQAAEGG